MGTGKQLIMEFDEFDGEGGDPVSKSLEERIGKVEEFLKKKKYPYPYPAKKGDEDNAEDMKKENGELKEKLAKYENAEKEKLVGGLIDMEMKKGLLSEENKGEMHKAYMTYSTEQLEQLKKRAESVDAEAVKKSFKTRDTEGAGRDFEKEKKELEGKIQDFKNCGIETEGLEKELQALKEEA